jgi:hypothetical protein
MIPRLIILSDLWGEKKSKWLGNYIDELSPYFEIKYYDCCVLGELDTSTYTEKKLHQLFLNGGIEIAVQNLLKAEKKKVHILAFSIGGVIAWKSILMGLNIASLYAISSTRLRYETHKPKGRIELYFGKNDIFKPNKEWFNQMNINATIENNKGHNIYTEPKFAKELCSLIYTTI